MGMMGAAGGGSGGRRGEHQPAGYLVDAINTSELVGPAPKVTPAVLGAAGGDVSRGESGTAGTAVVTSTGAPGITPGTTPTGTSPGSSLGDERTPFAVLPVAGGPSLSGPTK